MKVKVSKMDENGTEVVKGDAKPNSRVTKKHIDQLLDAMKFASDNDVDGYQRLGYLSFAVATVLKEVGYPQHYEAISKRMWVNFGAKTE